MKFGVLGPMVVTDQNNHLVRLRGHRQRALLAMLLFHANRVVPADALVGVLWPESPPKSYVSNLHTYVSRLRVRLDGVSIVHAGRGYRLHVATSDVDLLVFREQAAAGRQAARAGQADLASEQLRLALAQWRGRPLADLHVPALDAEIARLESEQLTVFEDCADAELAAGKHAELTGELQASLTEHPLRERMAGQLMLALQRAGRQADALEVYRNTRATLIDELGVEPGATLRRLHAAVLRGENDITEPKQDSVWPICQLPGVPADFSGRAGYLDEVADLLKPAGDSATGNGTVPVVVLSGEPGAGKTTLAISVAHRVRAAFPDGQLFVPLSGVDSPRDTGSVLADLLRGLGVSGPAIPDDLEARAAAYRGKLTDRKVLVVLDDGADPAQVRPLLPGTPGSAVLITSRRRLSGLACTQRISVGPLSQVEAIQLLARIAGRERVDAERADAVRIATACGNLPLALRIAGTRLALRPNMRLGALADRLENEGRRLDELQVSDLQVRASLELSYSALTDSGRETLRRIGLLTKVELPEWTIAMVLGSPVADHAVEELVEAGLLEPIGTDQTGEPRYRLHDLIRVFALDHAISDDGAEARLAAGRTIMDAVIGLADIAARRMPWTVPLPQLSGTVPTQPLPADLVARLVDDAEAWFAAERANIMVGIPRMCAAGWLPQALLIMDRLSVYLWAHGHYSDMRLGYQNIADHARITGERLIGARAKSVLALLRHARGQYEPAVEEYRECARELAELDDRKALAWVHNNLAACLIAVGRPEESIRLASSARAELEDDRFAIGSVLHTHSAALNRLGRTDESARLDEEALELAKAWGEPRQMAMALHDRAWGMVLAGDLDKARTLAEETVALLRTTGSRSALARALRTLGAVQAGLGEREESVRSFSESRQIARDLTEKPRELSCTRALAAAWVGEGRATEAVPVLRGCLTTYRQMGSAPATTITLQLLAVAYEKTGEHTAARQARDEADRIGDPRDTNTSTLLKLLLNLAVPQN